MPDRNSSCPDRTTSKTGYISLHRPPAPFGKNVPLDLGYPVLHFSDVKPG
jgi:hypothetical protein